MKRVKFLHCADMHLDSPFTSLGADTGKASERRRDLRQTFGKIMDIAKTEKVDLVLISGDLYEHNYTGKSTIAYINDKFREILHTHIFIIPGNHDPYVANSFYRNYAWSSNVHILCGDNPEVVLHDLKTCVYGIGFKDFRQEAAQIRDIKLSQKDYINILLLHGTVDMDFRQDNHLYNPVGSSELAGLGMDYIALGHFHGRSDDIGGHGLIYNPGSPEPLGFDETGEHGVYIGSISKDGDGHRCLDMSFRCTGKRYYANMDVNISGCDTEEKVEDRIRAAVEGNRCGHGEKDGLFHVTLKGYAKPGLKIDTRQLTSCFKDRVFFMKIKDNTAPDLDFDAIKREPGLRGLFARKIFQRMEKTEDQHQRELLLKSLYYGIEALDSGKVEIE